ncbi:hypothetical protein FCR2A7T_25300 [Flavobacterium cauense R2A-7]|uniref:Uncharacterized protein n=1 Tax=Flavobacterium cauense R2A-7 TaxID=1341154 RepID=V6RXA6_9FLAO|nr:hypothetical protein [Flavobacterium cauense]ESU19108.1 hypothetical protein FCR2A7T_25300 [Flavobacterium cauense R2A-7]KGO82263.1 hypothetical protein Q762_06140 [Flavobacterium cauense R2A-7]TWI15221.1 hypothetical protein IP98_00212 [Flavobacterium cauense R2A-7]
MTTDTKLISRIGYKDIFKKSINKDKLIEKIELVPALEFLTVLNKFEYKVHEKDTSELRFICNDWLKSSDEKIKKTIIDYYTNFLTENKRKQRDFTGLQSIKIINQTATLRVIELLLAKGTNNCKSEYDEENLFKLYLSVNDEIAERENIFFEKWQQIFGTKHNEIRFHMYLGINQAIMNREPLGKKIWVEALKFIQFEKWIKNQSKYENFTKDYLKKFDSSEWYELFTLIFHLNKLAINNYKFNVDENSKDLKLLSYFSNHEEKTPNWNEFSEIRKRPLFKLPNGEYLILDFSFLLDKFFSGIYHDILEFSNNTNVNGFHQDYSTNFIEKHLLVNTLKAVFGKSYIQFDEIKIKSVGKKGVDNIALPDYYVRNGNKIFVFECKNSLISNKLKIEADCDAIENDLKNKFYHNGTKNKAVKQLLNFVELSDNGQYKFFDTNTKLEKCIYYPILITTDNTLTSLGFNAILNEYMSNDLRNIDNSLKNRIKPLTIIHINDILLRTTQLKKLDLLIEDYIKYYRSKKAVDSFISFSDYLERVKFKNNSSLDHKSYKEILNNSMFPEN